MGSQTRVAVKRGGEWLFTTFHQVFFREGTYLFGPDSTLIRFFPEQLWYEASLAAGALNTVGFYKIGIYSSHMTGAVSTLADRLALGDWTGAMICLGLVASFVAGAAASTLLANEGQRRGLAGIHALSQMVDAAARDRVPGVDRPLDGRHAAMAGQERGGVAERRDPGLLRRPGTGRRAG